MARFIRLTEAPLKGGLGFEELTQALRLRFLTPISQPVALISQVQRSGGTLLSQLLDGHSRLYVHPHELHIGRPDKTFWPDLDIGAEGEALFELLFEKKSGAFAQTGYQKRSKAEREINPRYEEEVLPFLFSTDLQRTIFTRLIKQRPPTSQRRVLDAYITSYFNAWIDYQGLHRDPDSVKFWAAFAPRLAGDPGSYARLVRDYPDGTIITIVRSPLSWYASARAHSPAYDAPGEAARLWRDNYAAILAHTENDPGRACFIAFEELVAETETAMQRVCAFLGIGFEPTLLRPTFNGLDIKSDSSFGAKYGIDRSALDRTEELDGETRTLISGGTSETYDALRRAVDESARRYAKQA